MKKFSFPLDNVLNYKQQVLDSLMNEHAVILAEIRDQEVLIESVKDQYVACSEELKERQQNGIAVMQIYVYENYLDVLIYQIKKEQEVLRLLRQKEEAKRRQVIAARKESASIGRLKENKIIIYNKEVQKEEERLIDEFVANSRNKKLSQMG